MLIEFLCMVATFRAGPLMMTDGVEDAVSREVTILFETPVPEITDRVSRDVTIEFITPTPVISDRVSREFTIEMVSPLPVITDRVSREATILFDPNFVEKHSAVSREYTIGGDAVIQGTIVFNDLDDPSLGPSSVEVEMRRPLTLDVIGTFTLPLDEGAFSFVGSRTIFDISFKSGTWLRRTIRVDNRNGDLTSLTIYCTNGDCDDDNEVNLVDFGTVSAAFGSIEGDPNWNANADLNRDGEVNLVDFGIVSANFGDTGDE